jgi:hypothetical protein
MRKKGSIYRTRKIKKHITNQQFNKLINSCKHTKHSILLRVLRYEGLRLEEGLRLSIQNKIETNYLNIKKGTITFNRQKNGNDGEIWFLRTRTIRLLTKYLEKFGETIIENNGWLFHSQKTKSHLSIQGMEVMMFKKRKELGWDDLTYGKTKRGYKKHIICFHACKHEHHREVLRNMATKWGRIDTISALMMTRHKSLAGLQPYINEVTEVKKSLVNELMN